MNPIKAAQAALEDVILITSWISVIIDKAVRHNFGLKPETKKVKLLEDMGGIPGMLTILDSVEVPRGFVLVQIECQAPIFTPCQSKGRRP